TCALPIWLLVTFPANQGVALKPDGEGALLALAVARLVQVGVVPAVGVENVLQGRRTQQITNLFASHPRLQAGHLLGSDPVPLLNVGAVREAPFRGSAGAPDRK